MRVRVHHHIGDGVALVRRDRVVLVPPTFTVWAPFGEMLPPAPALEVIVAWLCENVTLMVCGACTLVNVYVPEATQRWELGDPVQQDAGGAELGVRRPCERLTSASAHRHRTGRRDGAAGARTRDDVEARADDAGVGVGRGRPCGNAVSATYPTVLFASTR